MDIQVEEQGQQRSPRKERGHAGRTRELAGDGPGRRPLEGRAEVTDGSAGGKRGLRKGEQAGSQLRWKGDKDREPWAKDNAVVASHAIRHKWTPSSGSLLLLGRN